MPLGFVTSNHKYMMSAFAEPISAHRTLIVRRLKGLEDIIPYTSVHWEMLEKGKVLC